MRLGDRRDLRGDLERPFRFGVTDLERERRLAGERAFLLGDEFLRFGVKDRLRGGVRDFLGDRDLLDGGVRLLFRLSSGDFDLRFLFSVSLSELESRLRR